VTPRHATSWSLSSGTTTCSQTSGSGSRAAILDDVENDQTVEGRGRGEMEGLMQAMKKLRTAAQNLAALQHGHQEMEHRLGDLEHSAAQRSETLERLRGAHSRP
jgi:hypothetical protein